VNGTLQRCKVRGSRFEVRDRPAGQIKSTLNLLRNRYFLRFRPQGVSAEGWHELKVSVRENHDVVARRGYYGAK
jgi:hypothetical protein